MKTINNYIYTVGIFIFLSLVFQTCKKDKIECLHCDKCENFPKPKKNELQLNIFYTAESQKRKPCFNPNNGDEFVYVKEEGQKLKLIKYNLQTKSETILLENTDIINQPHWGSNGWIVYNDSHFQIKMMKDDGSIIKTVTTSPYSYAYKYPDWLNDSTIACEFSFSKGLYYCEIDIHGAIHDTIKGIGFRYGVVNRLHESVNVALDASNINLRTNSNLTTQVTSFEANGVNSISGMAWHSNNQDIYFSTNCEGLFQINRNTKKVIKVRNGCDTRSYLYLSISADGKKILVERDDITKPSDVITHESKIYIMDINGENERNVFE